MANPDCALLLLNRLEAEVKSLRCVVKEMEEKGGMEMQSKEGAQDGEGETAREAAAKEGESVLERVGERKGGILKEKKKKKSNPLQAEPLKEAVMEKASDPGAIRLYTELLSRKESILGAAWRQLEATR